MFSGYVRVPHLCCHDLILVINSCFLPVLNKLGLHSATLGHGYVMNILDLNHVLTCLILELRVSH